MEVPVTEIVDEASVNQIAQVIYSRGMTVPAVFTLELCKPLTGVFHAAALGALPFLQMLCGLERTQVLMKLLDSRESIENLICRLESLSATPHGN